MRELDPEEISCREDQGGPVRWFCGPDSLPAVLAALVTLSAAAFFFGATYAAMWGAR